MASKNGGHAGEGITVANKYKANDGGGQEGAGIRDTGGNYGRVASETRENGSNHGRFNVTTTNKGNEDDGIQSYIDKTGYIEIRFMTGTSKGFNFG
jgi:hypothetical protein